MLCSITLRSGGTDNATAAAVLPTAKPTLSRTLTMLMRSIQKPSLGNVQILQHQLRFGLSAGNCGIER